MTATTRRLVFLESFLGNFLFSICMLFGVSLTSAVSAGVIMASIPAVVAVLSWVFLRERIAAATWAGDRLRRRSASACSRSRSRRRAQRRLAAAAMPWLGNLLVFGAVLCEAAYAVIGKKLTGGSGPKRITALINLWGFALVTPFGLYAALRFDFGAVRARPLAAAAVLRAGRQHLDRVALDDGPEGACPAAQAGVFTVMLPVSARRWWACWRWANRWRPASGRLRARAGRRLLRDLALRAAAERALAVFKETAGSALVKKTTRQSEKSHFSLGNAFFLQ